MVNCFLRVFILNVFFLFLGKIELFFFIFEDIFNCILERFIFFVDNVIKYKNRKYKLNLKLMIE